MKQISKSMQLLHQNQIIHRDINPEDFMKFNDEFKLINFYLVKNANSFIQKLNIGTKLFQALEIQNEQLRQSYPVDVWSLGGTFYEILTNQDFNINNIKKMQITSSEPNMNQINQLFIQLLEKMVQNDPLKIIQIYNKVKENLDKIEESIQESFRNSNQVFFNKANYNNIDIIETNFKDFIIKQMDKKLQKNYSLNIFQQNFSQFLKQFNYFF